MGGRDGSLRDAGPQNQAISHPLFSPHRAKRRGKGDLPVPRAPVRGRLASEWHLMRAFGVSRKGLLAGVLRSRT